MKKTKSGSKEGKGEASLSANRCENQGASDWRVETLARIRNLIKQSDAESSERDSVDVPVKQTD
jgi:hypothetical protein